MTSRIFKVLGRLGIALFALAAFVTITDKVEQIVVTVAVFVVVAARVSLGHGSYDRLLASCMGLALPIVPWLGKHVLLVPLLTFFALRSLQIGAPIDSKGEKTGIAWVMPFLSFLFGTVLGELFRSTGLGDTAWTVSQSGHLTGVRIDGVMRVADLIRALLDVHVTTWGMGVRVLLAALLISWFSSNIVARQAFVRSLARGCVILAVYATGQYLAARYSGSLASSGVFWKLPNQTDLWDSLGRPSGLVSDPNALGVVLALALWISFLSHSAARLSWLWSVLLSIAGIVSGSRTFLISLALLLFLIAWYQGRRKLIWGALSSAAAAVVITTLLDSYSGLVGQLVASESLPVGVRRGVAALSLMRLEETFMSRGVFIDLAGAIGKGHWIFGVGADRFIEYVPLVGAELNLVRGWKDNSNNLYVGIVTELGLVGAVLFILTIIGRRVRIAEPQVEQHPHLTRDVTKEAWKVCAVWCLVMLGILGCTGPHTDFIEVLVLVAYLVAVTTEQGNLPQRLRCCLPRDFWGRISGSTPCTVMSAVTLAVVTVVWVALGFIASWHHEQGVYGWVNTTTGATRWLSHSATIAAQCRRGAQGESRVVLLLRPQYIPQSEPLRVLLTVSGQEPQEYLFRSSDVREVTALCSIGNTDQESEETFVHVSTSPAWSPYRAWPRVSGDRRILGVQQVMRAGRGSGEL